MKKYWPGIFLIFFLVQCSRLVTLNTDQVQGITLEEFEKNGDYYTKILTEKKKPLILIIPKEKKIPLEIQFKIAYAKISFNQNELSFNETLFFYLSLSGLYISKDKIKWAPIQDLKAINEMYHQKGGSLSLNFGVVKNKGASVLIKVETYELNQ